MASNMRDMLINGVERHEYTGKLTPGIYVTTSLQQVYHVLVIDDSGQAADLATFLTRADLDPVLDQAHEFTGLPIKE